MKTHDACALAQRPISVLVVDDQACVRTGLRMRLALEPDIDVVGEAADGTEAIELARNLEPDVVVMDVVMPGISGPAATLQLLAGTPDTRVVLLSLYDDARTRREGLDAGAVRFVSKGDDGRVLAEAIRAAGHEDPGSK